MNTSYQLVDSLFQKNNFTSCIDVADKYIEQSSKDPSDTSYLKVMLMRGVSLEELNRLREALKQQLIVLENAQKSQFKSLQFEVLLSIALINEKNGNLDACKAYLDQAKELDKNQRLRKENPYYFIRWSSYYRMSGSIKLAVSFAEKAIRYGKDHQLRSEIDGYILMGHFSEDTPKKIAYYDTTAQLFLLENNYSASASMLCNISGIYLNQNNLDSAIVYLEKAEPLFSKSDTIAEARWFLMKSDIFAQTGMMDSALSYHKLYAEVNLMEMNAIQNTEIHRIQKEFDTEKKEQALQSQLKENESQRTVSLALALLFLLVGLATILLIAAYRRLNKKSKIVLRQKEELTESVGQKKLLLSEVQHRVKNNLQLIIGLLEFQKEKVNLEEAKVAITQGQAKIKSIALLHNKLNFESKTHYVEFHHYLKEITHLLRDSFDDDIKKITFETSSELETISIDQATSLGLILVELINNSLKYAFVEKETGKISIRANKLENGKSQIVYQDNGIGLDTKEKINRGSGLEIIEGLTQQLKGKIEMINEGGLKTIITF